MTIDERLLTRFFQNQCTEEEALKVVAYLNERPEKLEELLPEALWQNMEETSTMPPGKKEELLHTIALKTGLTKITSSETNERSTSLSRGKNMRLIITLGLSLAAALLLILKLDWWIGGDVNEPAPLTNSAPAAYTLVQINYGKEDMKLNIADGSVIFLKPGGEIRYLEQLSTHSRDFKLKGAARFKVAEDKKRPFNVYASGTITTALGTDFTVSSQEDDNQVSVLLHSGKVVVSPESNTKTNSMKKTYLLPGNELLIDKTNFSSTLIKNAKVPKLLRKNPNVKGQTEVSATEITFRNQSLDKIFQLLRSDFSAVIEYDQVQLRGMYFTGSFKRDAEVVNTILNEIALLNHLNIQKKDGVYILRHQTDKSSTN